MRWRAARATGRATRRPQSTRCKVSFELSRGWVPLGVACPLTDFVSLVGVMRFLQTEWHRHERDRNAWEIDRQEMKGRIASLEGQARRSDATQKALKKYVGMLERKVKQQSNQLKAGGNATDGVDKAKLDKLDREAMIQEKLRGKSEPQSVLCIYERPWLTPLCFSIGR